MQKLTYLLVFINILPSSYNNDNNNDNNNNDTLNLLTLESVNFNGTWIRDNETHVYKVSIGEYETIY